MWNIYKFLKATKAPKNTPTSCCARTVWRQHLSRSRVTWAKPAADAAVNTADALVALNKRPGSVKITNNGPANGVCSKTLSTNGYATPQGVGIWP